MARPTMSSAITRLLGLALLLVVPGAVRAQLGGGSMTVFPGVPTGSCLPPQLAVNSANGNLYDCVATVWTLATGGGGGGSGTINSGTTNTLPKYVGATTVGNSLLSDDATTLTYTGAGGLVSSGPLSALSDGVHPGNIILVGNTTVVTPLTNTFNLMGPSVASFTAYALQFASAAPAANNVMLVGAPTSGVSQVTYGAVPHAAIAATAVTPASYTNPNITIAPDGSITAASNGVAGGITAAGSFSQPFTAQTTVTITGATHGLGTSNLGAFAYDNATPGVLIPFTSLTVNTSTNDVVATFGSSKTGKIVLIAGASKYIAGFASTLSLSIPAATHNLGASIFNVTIFDSAIGTRNLVRPDKLSIDASGNITVAFAVLQAGQVVVE